MESATEKLERLREKLKEITKGKNRPVNVFDAVGMRTQEIKHSAFLAWLLDRNQPHKLGNRFLELFLRELIDHPEPEGEESRAKNNRDILRETKIHAFADFSEFLADGQISVQTETVIRSAESRMDLFLESQKAKTVAVIENKVFTTTHDNQLQRYEEELKDREGWRKIFVYLTPKGDAPYDYNEPRENWCVMSYRALIKICKEILRELPNGKDNARLRILLEDYIEMVDTNLLNGNPEVRRLCKQILREHGEALEILKAYTDNAEEAVIFCKQYLQTHLAGFRLYRDGKTSFEFYTQSAEAYFGANGETIFTPSKRLKLRYGITGAKGAAEAYVTLEKEQAEPWSTAQGKLLNAVPNRAGEKYCTLFSEELLSEEERAQEFQAVKDALELRLQGFIRAVEEFEIKYFR